MKTFIVAGIVFATVWLEFGLALIFAQLFRGGNGLIKPAYKLTVMFVILFTVASILWAFYHD